MAISKRSLGLMKTAVEFSRYNFAHDEFDHATQKLREWKWAQLPKAAFRMPVAFGPDPSLIPAVPASGSSPNFCTTSVRFRTSRTLIQGLLPPEFSGISFDTPGTLSECSWIHTQFQNVPRLHGGRYSILGLYLHDIAHQGSGGQKSRGTFVPVAFENLTHTVVRDREVYGLPVVYSEINARHSSSSVHVTASLNGRKWFTMALEDLKIKDSRGSLSSKAALLPGDTAADTALFSWRSVPKFSTESEADNSAGPEAFAVKVSFDNDDSTLQVQQAFESSAAKIEFELQDPSAPCCFGPIVERLAEIPNHAVLGAQIILGSGAPALKQAYRI
jgi:hypothetical protein